MHTYTKKRNARSRPAWHHATGFIDQLQQHHQQPHQHSLRQPVPSQSSLPVAAEIVVNVLVRLFQLLQPQTLTLALWAAVHAAHKLAA